MKPRILILTVALLCLLAVPNLALADNEPDGKIDSSVVTVLEATGGNVAVPVMVNAPGALDQVTATIPLGVDITQLPLVDSVAAFLTPDEIRALGDASFVTAIVADNLVHGFDYQSTMDVTNLTIGLGDVPAPADGGPAGAGVTVAVLDSGVATNTDLAASRIVGWKDFVNDQPTPYDDAGHGTFVAGLIAGDGTASLPLENGGFATVQFRGVAPAADIVGIKVLDEVGQGRASAMIAGIAWAIAHKDDYNIRVLNISIGGNPVGPIKHDPIAMAVEAAWQQRHHRRVRGRQRGRLRRRRRPLPRQRSLRHHRGRHRHAADRRRRRRRRGRLQLGGPDPLRRGRQAGPRGARQPPGLPAHAGLLHRHQLPGAT